MNDLDLDINNYNVKNLETFFRLPDKYNEHDIAQKETEIRTLLLDSGHIPVHLKRNLIIFLEEGKTRLIEAKINNQNPTTLPHQPQALSVDTLPKPTTTNSVLFPSDPHKHIHTPYTEYYPGTLNQIDYRYFQKCMTIDSRFRKDGNNSNSDFLISLPNKILKVVSVECAAFEIDRHSLYNISSSLGNNYIYISVGVTEQKEYNQVFVIPDGHYDLDYLLETLNRMLKIQSNTPFIHLEWKKDPYGSQKCILMIIDQESYIQKISLDFTVDIAGNSDKFQDSFSKMGFLLGFTKKRYTGKTFYMGEIPVRMTASLPYFYLSIEDFQNRSVACFQPAFSQMTMPPSILARISLREQEPVEIIVSTPRKYIGPVDLSRFQIRLLDAHGKILQMDAHFSFCLVFQTMNDM